MVPNQFSKGNKVQLLPFCLFWVDLTHCQQLKSGCTGQLDNDPYHSLLVEIIKLGISVLVISALVVLQRIFEVYIKNSPEGKNSIRIEFITQLITWQDQVTIGDEGPSQELSSCQMKPCWWKQKNWTHHSWQDVRPSQRSLLHLLLQSGAGVSKKLILLVSFL